MSIQYSYLRPQRFLAADTRVAHDPFPYIVAKGILAQDRQAELARDYPTFEEPGYFPYVPEECGEAVRGLVEEITSPVVEDQLGELLGIERLSQYPTLVSISGSLNRRHGTIHTDSRSKVATALVYMNESWDASSGGCLRFLEGSDDIDRVLAPEVAPLFGNFAMFRRTDNSFHGHLPYEGARRVIQIAWIINAEEKDRKIRRGRFSRWLKGLFKETDCRLGAERRRNAAHLN